MLLIIGIILIISIVYFFLVIFGLSLFAVGKKADEKTYLERKKYLEEASKTGELDIEEIEKLKHENDNLLQ